MAPWAHTLAPFLRHAFGKANIPISTVCVRRVASKMWTHGCVRGVALASVGGTAALLTSSRNYVQCKQEMPKSIKIYYGDMQFWRAECVRMCLFLGDVPFADVRDQKRDDLKAQGKLTFGATPVLEVDGKILSQTQAMATYCGKLAGIHPTDAWGAAKVDEAINGCTDVTNTIGQTFRLPNEEKVEARQKLIAPDGRLTMHLNGLEKILAENGGNGYVFGDSITVADLAIWRLVGWLSGGVIDGIPKSYVRSTFPNISAVCDKVDLHPKVKDWKKKHAKFYG